MAGHHLAPAGHTCAVSSVAVARTVRSSARNCATAAHFVVRESRASFFALPANTHTQTHTHAVERNIIMSKGILFNELNN